MKIVEEKNKDNIIKTTYELQVNNSKITEMKGLIIFYIILENILKGQLMNNAAIATIFKKNGKEFKNYTRKNLDDECDSFIKFAEFYKDTKIEKWEITYEYQNSPITIDGNINSNMIDVLCEKTQRKNFNFISYIIFIENLINLSFQNIYKLFKDAGMEVFLNKSKENNSLLFHDVSYSVLYFLEKDNKNEWNYIKKNKYDDLKNIKVQSSEYECTRKFIYAICNKLDFTQDKHELLSLEQLIKFKNETIQKDEINKKWNTFKNEVQEMKNFYNFKNFIITGQKEEKNKNEIVSEPYSLHFETNKYNDIKGLTIIYILLRTSVYNEYYYSPSTAVINLNNNQDTLYIKNYDNPEITKICSKKKDKDIEFKSLDKFLEYYKSKEIQSWTINFEFRNIIISCSGFKNSNTINSEYYQNEFLTNKNERLGILSYFTNIENIINLNVKKIVSILTNAGVEKIVFDNKEISLLKEGNNKTGTFLWKDKDDVWHYKYHMGFDNYECAGTEEECSRYYFYRIRNNSKLRGNLKLMTLEQILRYKIVYASNEDITEIWNILKNSKHISLLYELKFWILNGYTINITTPDIIQDISEKLKKEDTLDAFKYCAKWAEENPDSNREDLVLYYLKNKIKNQDYVKYLYQYIFHENNYNKI